MCVVALQLDGGSAYLTTEYRQFGQIVYTGASSFNPAFGFAQGGGWAVGTTVRFAAPSVCTEASSLSLSFAGGTLAFNAKSGGAVTMSMSDGGESGS